MRSFAIESKKYEQTEEEESAENHVQNHVVVFDFLFFFHNLVCVRR